MDPQPIPYATPSRRGGPSPEVLTAPTVGWRTAAGAAWLAAVLAVAWGAVTTLCDQEQALASLLARVAGGEPFAPADLVAAVAGRGGFALAVGGLAAVVLYHWPTRRLAWAVVLPVAAGLGTAVAMAADSPAGGWVPGLSGAVALQAGLVYAGTHLGRPLARWLARHLVPPPLRASLVAVWI